MAQHDYAIANDSGANVRADLNNVLEAIATINSGSSSPGTTFPYQFWADTTTGLLKQRNSANTAWIVKGVLAEVNFGLQPPGVVSAYAGAAAPSGWLLCDGAAVSRATYADLFAVIGTTYGSGDGSTTFNLPDITGRVVAGKEASETRLTTAGCGINGGTLGAAGGAQTLSAHTHGAGSLSAASGGTHTHDTGVGGGFATTAAGSGLTLSVGAQNATAASTGTTGSAHTHTVTGTSGSTGTGSHGSVQPTIVLNYIIKT